MIRKEVDGLPFRHLIHPSLSYFTARHIDFSLITKKLMVATYAHVFMCYL